jgi:D-alanyl-D-alanine carboxypeptidase
MISEKGNNRIIVVVFGGKNTKILNAQMIEVASLGFRK